MYEKQQIYLQLYTFSYQNLDVSVAFCCHPQGVQCTSDVQQKNMCTVNIMHTLVYTILSVI
jgi:uncharacterized protein YeaC (DUF1315 family)